MHQSQMPTGFKVSTELCTVHDANGNSRIRADSFKTHLTDSIVVSDSKIPEFMRALFIFLMWCMFSPSMFSPHNAMGQNSTTDESSSSSSTETVQQWARDLNSRNFRDREAAMRQLLDAGERAIPHVVKAAENGSTEAVWRALFILDRFSMSDDYELMDGAVLALESLAKSSRPQLAARAASALAKHQDERDQLAMMRLRTLGANVTTLNGSGTSVRLDNKWKGGNSGLVHLKRLKSITSIRFEQSMVSDRGLVHLAGMDRLQRAYLGATQIRGPGLVHLKDCPRLTYLSLKGLTIDDEAAWFLGQLTQLEHLGLDETPLSDRAMSHLVDLQHLKTLWLNRTKVTDSGLVHLAKIEPLEKLILTGTQIDGAGLSHFKDSKNLKYLSLQHVDFTDDGMKHIAGLSQLETLGLDDTKITGAGLQHVVGLEKLSVLWLSNTQVSDASIEHFKQFQGLTKLYLKGTKLTSTGVQRLRKALPHCYIVH